MHDHQRNVSKLHVGTDFFVCCVRVEDKNEGKPCLARDDVVIKLSELWAWPYIDQCNSAGCGASRCVF